MATEGLVIGVDFGTGSSKGVLVRPNGGVVASAVREHRTSMPKPGHHEHDADEVWWKDFTDIVGELLSKADGPVVAAHVRHRPLPAACRRPGHATAPGDPVRRRHAGAQGGRGAERAVR